MRGDESLANLATFDPRPEDYRQDISYSTYFRNTYINSRCATAPILQLYMAANMYAFSSDHDYLPKSPADMFLDAFLITTIDEHNCQIIERYSWPGYKQKMDV